MTQKEKQQLLSQIKSLIDNIPIEEQMAISQVKSTDKPQLLTIKECAEEISGLSEHTVRQLVAQNKLPYIRSGAGKRGKILINKSILLKYFEENI